MFKKIISKEIQQALMAGVTIFALLLFWGGRMIIKGYSSNLKKIRKERVRIKLENEVGIKLNELIKIKKQMQVIDESSRFLAEVAKIAGQMNMKLKAITAMPREKRTEFIKLAVSLEVETTYHELGLFISRIESSAVFMSIARMELSSELTSESAQKPPILARLIISTMSLTDTILEQ